MNIIKLKKHLKKFDRLYLFSFLIPVFIMLVIFFIQDIYPFGKADRSFLHIDMYHQYFPFLVEFYHKLKSGESLFYSWNTGIGSNFLALYVYYLASPFNWLCVLFPEHLLMEFLSYMVILKIGLCGLTFTHYVRKHFHTGSWGILCFSLFYALSGFMAAYNWNVMWLDVIVLAPLTILGIERLVTEGKCKLYCITLGLSILSNYYLSIMLCIFLTLYFAVLMIAKKPGETDKAAPLAFPRLCNIKNFYVKAVLRFIVYSLLSGCMAAILLLPELTALKFTEFSDINFPSKVSSYFSVFDMLARHCFQVTVETGLDHWPNIYCGTAVFLFLPLYAIQEKIPLREKAPKLILLGFILISFSTNVLNFIWHGFNYPDSLPARQSFLYIFLVLVLCFEAFLHIKEYTAKVLMTLFLSALFFIILCEKLVTDDAFTSMCFLATGIFLLFYAGFIHALRMTASAPKRLAFLAITIVIIESSMNTYLTSVPTVSRTTYLSNYDSYQTLTDRTVEKEQGDFFRFEKFARRTQNDAMLIGFQGASYFSSTLNSLVSDFYEKYGMRGSRVNYCYEGATPVTAALLANRYMLYTLERDYDNLFELADTEGNLYLYKNNYSLPLGYVISDEEDYHKLFSNAEEVEETLHEEDDDDTSGLNPIERQNRLVHKLGIDGEVFIPVPFNSYGSEAELYTDEAAHYYAYTKNTKIDTVKMNYEEHSKSFTQIKKKYILDIGYHDAGKTVALNSENGESLNLSIYKVDEAVLREFIDTLSRQTFVVENYDELHLDGHITITDAGQLVFSIPYEPGWTLRVDGSKIQNIDLFENTFISIYLEEGEHTISLSYFPKGFIPGVVLSIIGIMAFAAICIVSKRYRTKE